MDNNNTEKWIHYWKAYADKKVKAPFLYVTFHADSSKSKSKIHGIASISTSSLVNPFCVANSKNKDLICSHCYGVRHEKLFKQLEQHLIDNTLLLSKTDLSEEQVQELFGNVNVNLCRFNAFGELVNQKHFDNLFKIVKTFPKTTFSLFTKRHNLVNKKAKNLILVASSPKISVPCVRPKGFDKTFTVYDFHTTESINCQKRCIECQLCYTKNRVVKIKERVK